MSEEDRNPKEHAGISTDIVAIPKDGELRRFFERLRSTGALKVNDGSQEFLIKISRSQISTEARDLLVRGGPISE